MMKDRILNWTPALIERFWRAAYAHGLQPVLEARRRAPFLAAIMSQHVPPPARIVELGSRDAILASYLTRAGYRVGRMDTGPLYGLLPEGMAEDPHWLGDQTLMDRRLSDLVIANDVISRLTDDELPGFFAAARLMLKWTGVLCIITRNSEPVNSGYAICPETGKIFNGMQRLRSFDAPALKDMLAREGFSPVAVIQAELNSEALARHARPPLETFADKDAFIGNGEMLVTFARLECEPHGDDVDVAGAWLAARLAAAQDAPAPQARPFVWNTDTSRAFWNAVRGTPLDDQSFGAQVGRSLLAIVEPWLVKGGRHLEMGAGAGDVADLLLEAGYPVAALEASDGRRAGLQERLGGRSGYLGTLHNLDQVEPFDVVLASEVIEHVDEADDAQFLGAIRKALKPDGVLVISTPSQEDRHASLQYSPEADILFHRWQHVRSFSPQSLAATLAAHGLRCDVVHDVDFAAVARGAAPFFESVLATTEPKRIGAGGTLVAIARPVQTAAHTPPPTARRVVERRVARAPIYASIAHANVAAYEEAVHAPPAPAQGAEKQALTLMKYLGAAYERLGPPLRRALPAPIKARLARFVPKIEQALAPLATRKLTDDGIRLCESQALMQRAAFDDGPILLVNNALAWGGVERQVVNTLRGLERRAKRGVGLICLKLSEGGDYAFYQPALSDFRGIVRDMAPLEAAKATLAALFDETARERVNRTIGWMPSDVQENILRLMADFATLKPVVVHAWQDALSIEAAFAAKLIGVPKIITSARNMSPPNFAYFRPHQRDGYREIAACDDVVMLSNSDAGAVDYADWLGIARQRFGIVRNGIDASSIKRAPQASVDELRKSLGISEGAQIIGSIFRFYDEKQPMLWMEVAREVAHRVKGTHFVVFGVGPKLEEARAYAAEHGFADRFHAPGTIEDAALGLSLFDVFVLTSRFEGTPNVVLEASCVGVPVVATPAGGTAEAVADEVTGWVVTPEDWNVMANRVCQALGDTEWRRACGVRGPEFVRQRFGLDRMIKETIGLYGLPDLYGQGDSDVLHQSSQRAARD